MADSHRSRFADGMEGLTEGLDEVGWLVRSRIPRLTPFGRSIVSAVKQAITPPSVLKLRLIWWLISPRHKSTISLGLTRTASRAARMVSQEMPAAFLPVRCNFKLLRLRNLSQCSSRTSIMTSGMTRGVHRVTDLEEFPVRVSKDEAPPLPLFGLVI